MITQKEEKLVQGLFLGLSQRNSYKQAYDTKKMKNETIDNKAYKLAKKNEIRTRLEELQKQVSEKNGWTIQKLVEEFENLIEATKAEKQYSATIKALENIGKLLGYYELKVKHSGEIIIEVDIQNDDE